MWGRAQRKATQNRREREGRGEGREEEARGEEGREGKGRQGTGGEKETSAVKHKPTCNYRSGWRN